MFGIGWIEMLVVGGIALMFLGEDKFPDFLKIALRAIRDFRGYWDDIRHEVEKEVRRPLEKELKPLQRELTNITRENPHTYERKPTPASEVPASPASSPEGAYAQTSPDMGTPHEYGDSPDEYGGAGDYGTPREYAEGETTPRREPDEPAGVINKEDARVMDAGAMPYSGGGPGARPAPAPESAPAPAAPAEAASEFDQPSPSRID